MERYAHAPDWVDALEPEVRDLLQAEAALAGCVERYLAAEQTAKAVDVREDTAWDAAQDELDRARDALPVAVRRADLAGAAVVALAKRSHANRPRSPL